MKESCVRTIEGNTFLLFFRQAPFPSDFPRRSRAYDLASYKCHEWRQMSMFLFPLILRSLGAGKSHEKSVFLAFSFLSRCMRMPDEEYDLIPIAMIEKASDILNYHYIQAFGDTAASYNFHIVGSHLREIRRYGPLTSLNAYPFEGTYSELRRSFMSGTRKGQ